MREKLEKSVKHLCLLYPQLSPNIRYSNSLSQSDVDIFVAFVNGHVDDVLRKSSDPHKRETLLSKYLKGSTGLSKITHEDVLYIESILAAASGRDVVPPKLKNIVEFLRNHRKMWWSLHRVYEKIVKNQLIGTCPICVSKLPMYDRLIPFGKKYHSFQEFHKLFHESIHYILEENGICFHDKIIDEGLVTYFHENVVGTKTCKKHYIGEGEQYLKYAQFFKRLFHNRTKNKVIPILKQLKREDLIKLTRA